MPQSLVALTLTSRLILAAEVVLEEVVNLALVAVLEAALVVALVVVGTDSQ